MKKLQESMDQTINQSQNHGKKQIVNLNYPLKNQNEFGKNKLLSFKFE